MVMVHHKPEIGHKKSVPVKAIFKLALVGKPFFISFNLVNFSFKNDNIKKDMAVLSRSFADAEKLISHDNILQVV